MSNMEDRKEDRKRFRSASNSSIAKASEVIPDHDMFQQAVAGLRRATEIKVEMSALDDELEEIKSTLGAICEGLSIKGFRHGLNCFEYQGWQSRKTLNRERLVSLLAEYGVPADVIDQAYRKGEPFLSCKINPFDIE